MDNRRLSASGDTDLNEDPKPLQSDIKVTNRGFIRNESLESDSDCYVRVSLQECNDPKLVLDKIRCLLSDTQAKHLQHQTSTSGPKIEKLNALIEILSILMVCPSNEQDFVGYVTYMEAYEIFVAHRKGPVDKDSFLLALLDKHHGLPVNVLKIDGIRYIVLKTPSFDYVNFFRLIGIVSETRVMKQK